ncbi:hypothetical protein C7S20_12685 [Christiangramia fulva]|uniref:Uncharacterized protein n=1 Tax=Christiangramia fulva TaxID=2126553 RepID=A0A2R3Z6Z2_9FLAO|nr:hypothetical protein C7S20_12685 [Christiangramia fulva]
MAGVAERAAQNQQFQFGLKIRIFSFLDFSASLFLNSLFNGILLFSKGRNWRFLIHFSKS